MKTLYEIDISVSDHDSRMFLARAHISKPGEDMLICVGAAASVSQALRELAHQIELDPPGKRIGR
jgi:hypothetical protein